MSDFALMLLIKSTLILTAGVCLAAVLRSCAASIRHLVWLSTLTALLILPVGLLFPLTTLAPVFHVDINSTAAEIAGKPGKVMRNAEAWLIWIWAAGFVVHLLRVAVAARRATQLVRSAKKLDDLTRISDDAGPLAWSFGKGAIILPEQSASWTADELSAVVQHEAAHIVRRDSFSLLIAEMACAVYWFHPLAWYAARRMRVELEHAADDCVLRAGTPPAEYATHLVRMATASQSEPLMAGAASRSLLSVRVEAILDRRRSRTMLNRRMVLASTAALLSVVLPLAAMQVERQVYKIGPGITPPVPIYREPVQYTPEAKDAKIEGTVLLSVVIEADGSVSNIKVARGLDAGLDKQAIRAMEKWRFKPATKGDVSVAVSASVETNFRLK